MDLAHPFVASAQVPIGHVVHAALVFTVLSPLALIAGRRLADPDLDIVPAPRFNLVNFFETAYGTIEKLCEESLGHHGHRFVYLVGTLALWILFSNLLGVIPGLVPPTDNVNTNFACAAVRLPPDALLRLQGARHVVPQALRRARRPGWRR